MCYHSSDQFGGILKQNTVSGVRCIKGNSGFEFYFHGSASSYVFWYTGFYMPIQIIFYVISPVTMKRTSVNVPKECL